MCVYIYIYIYIYIYTHIHIHIGVNPHNTLGGGAAQEARHRSLPLPPFGRPHRLGLPMVVCVECRPADKPWDVVSATRRSSGVAPWACVRVCWCRRIFTYIHKYRSCSTPVERAAGSERAAGLQSRYGMTNREAIYMNVYLCINTHTYISISISIYLYISIYIHTDTHTDVYMYMHIYVYTCIYVYVYR